jgi:hypothetical protein
VWHDETRTRRETTPLRRIVDGSGLRQANWLQTAPNRLSRKSPMRLPCPLIGSSASGRRGLTTKNNSAPLCLGGTLTQAPKGLLRE